LRLIHIFVRIEPMPTTQQSSETIAGTTYEYILAQLLNGSHQLFEPPSSMIHPPCPQSCFSLACINGRESCSKRTDEVEIICGSVNYTVPFIQNSTGIGAVHPYFDDGIFGDRRHRTVVQYLSNISVSHRISACRIEYQRVD